MADIPNYERTFAGRPDAYAAWRALAAAISGGMDHRTYEIATVAAARALRSTYCSLAHGEVLLERYADRDGLRALLAAADGVGVKADVRRTERTTGPDGTEADGSTSFATASTSPMVTPDAKALVADRDAAIAAFAARVARDAPHIDDTEREALRAHGLSDADIFDVILAVAARCFFSTVLDATGTRADASYRERLPVDLVTELTCGREPL